MRSSQENPVGNVLGPGINEAKVKQAIDTSGYPLQLVVAQELRNEFSLQEEWSFFDSETGNTRTIDLVASKWLFGLKEPQSRIRPTLNLVIECKQSDLPYVFFLSGSCPWLPDFPVISGLSTKNVVVTSDDDPSSWAFSPIQLLELYRHKFLTDSGPPCMTFSKIVRKGNELTLSGSDPYQRLVFPVLKAMWHFDSIQAPPSTAYYYDCNMVIGLGILDAPMIGVRLTDQGNEVQLLPWVRVVRHQTSPGGNKSERNQVFGIDMVHKDFLKTYIDQHVKPFAEEFARLALKHANVLADGRGFVPGMGQNGWTEIEPRLQRASLGAKGRRIQATFKGIRRLFRRGH